MLRRCWRLLCLMYEPWFPAYEDGCNGFLINILRSLINVLRSLINIPRSLTHWFQCLSMCSMALQGSLTSSTYPRPYADWTGYQPVNSAYDDPEDLIKWQPLLETNGRGYITVQTHTTPQAGQVPPTLVTESYFLHRVQPAFHQCSSKCKLGRWATFVDVSCCI